MYYNSLSFYNSCMNKIISSNLGLQLATWASGILSDWSVSWAREGYSPDPRLCICSQPFVHSAGSWTAKLPFLAESNRNTMLEKPQKRAVNPANISCIHKARTTLSRQALENNLSISDGNLLFFAINCAYAVALNFAFSLSHLWWLWLWNQRWRKLQRGHSPNVWNLDGIFYRVTKLLATLVFLSSQFKWCIIK